MDERPDGYAALPSRFKQYIGALEEQVADLKRTRPVAGKTGVRLRTYSRTGDDGGGYLPDGSRVEFTVSGGTIEVRVQDGDLQVRTDGLGAGRLAVLPEVSNQVIVRAVSR